VLKETAFHVDDPVKSTRHMESQGKPKVRFLDICLMGEKPAAVGEGEFHLVSVMEVIFRGNNVMNEDLGEGSYTSHGLFDVRFLILQLAFVSHVLPLTTAAKPVIGAGGLDPIHGGLKNFCDSGLGIILFLFNHLRDDSIPRHSTLDKYDQPLKATNALAAIGHVFYLEFDKRAFP
jgi:hypothetical protein